MKCFRDFVGVFKCKEEKDFSNITELATVVEKFYEYGCEIRQGFLFKDIEKFSKFKNIYNLDIYSLTIVFKKFSFSNKILKGIVK